MTRNRLTTVLSSIQFDVPAKGGNHYPNANFHTLDSTHLLSAKRSFGKRCHIIHIVEAVASFFLKNNGVVDSFVEVCEDAPEVLKSVFKILVDAKVNSSPDSISEFIEVGHLLSTFGKVDLVMGTFTDEIIYIISSL